MHPCSPREFEGHREKLDSWTPEVSNLMSRELRTAGDSVPLAFRFPYVL
jgi:hypothetical protein